MTCDEISTGEVQAFSRATQCAYFKLGFASVTCSPVKHRLLPASHGSFACVGYTSRPCVKSVALTVLEVYADTGVVSRPPRCCIMQTLPVLALTLALLPCVMSMYTAGEPS